MSLGAEGFDTFFAANYRMVVGTVDLAVGNRDMAEDAVQDAFAGAFARWRRVGAMERPAGWVYVTALRAARRTQRRAHRAPSPARRESVDAIDDEAGAHVLAESSLMALPTRERTATVLFYIADLTVAEIASAMGCRAGTVKATLHHARNHMRDSLDSDHEKGECR